MKKVASSLVTRAGVIVVSLVVISGCGGGNSTEGTRTGTLNLQAVWQQTAPPAAVRAHAAPVPPGFSDQLPASVQRVRVVFQSSKPASQGGLQCCVKVNPAQVADGTSHFLLVTGLPVGDATVTLAGFPGTIASAPTGVTDTCPTDPVTVGEACDSTPANPNFLSNPTAVTIVAGSQTDTPTIELNAVSTTTGTVSGSVVNCVNGSAISGAVVNLVGTSLAASTNSDGNFSLSGVPTGAFELQGSATGYITSTVSGNLDSDTLSANVTLTLCPVPAPETLRVVLTWGSGPPAPADLDAHLRGPAPDTDVAGQPVEFNLYFANRTIAPPPGNTFATLDIDSVEFSGPETETVIPLPPATGIAAGTYRFCVQDFSDRTNPQSQGFTNSQARVRVFLGAQQLGDFQAPSGTGTVWNVFSLDTSSQPPVLTALNSLSAESNSALVCQRIGGTAETNDADGDGLTDAQEAVLGTNPDNPDTYGLGIADGEAVIEGLIPLSGTRTPTGGTATPTTAPLTPTLVPTVAPSSTISPTPTLTSTPGVTPPTATPTGTPTACATSATPAQAGSIVVFEHLQVDATTDPLLALSNVSNSMVHADCFYADSTQPACTITPFSVTLSRLSSVQWQASVGNNSIPGAGNPFTGEVVCVEVDAGDLPLAGNHLAGTSQIAGMCPGAATGLSSFDNNNGDNTLCLESSVTDNCPTGQEYDSCPADIDPARIQGCWSQSQFIFDCGAAAPTATPTATPVLTPTGGTPGANGSSCSSGTQCQSGFCTDSVCCVSSSCPGGQRCDVPGSPGQCTTPPGSMLTAAISATDTTLTVTDATPFQQGDTIQVDSEQMLVIGTTVGAPTLTVQRGANGTTAAAHASGTLVSKIAGSGPIREFSLPPVSGRNFLGGITSGPDGALWFTDTIVPTSSIGRIDTNGNITEVMLPNSGAGAPDRITLGPDGNLWFTDSLARNVGQLAPPNAVNEFPLSTPGGSLFFGNGITTGSDGNLWFVVIDDGNGNGRIGRVTPAGVVTLFPPPGTPTTFQLSGGIASASDGNIWFTDYQGSLGRINPNNPGTIDEFAFTNSFPVDLTAGPDGNLWFTDNSNNQIGRVSPGSPTDVSTFDIPTDNASPAQITTGPDGRLWFTEIDPNANQIGRINPQHPSFDIAEFPIPTGNSDPTGISAGPDGNMWFTESNAQKIAQIRLGTLTGNVTYTGSMGPVSDTIPIAILLFRGSPQDGNTTDTTLVSANGAAFTLNAPTDTYHLAYYLDELHTFADDPDQLRVGAPYKIYNQTGAFPGDPITVPGSGLNLTLDDTNLVPGIAGAVSYTDNKGNCLVVEAFTDQGLTNMAGSYSLGTCRACNAAYELTFLTPGQPYYLRAFVDLTGDETFHPDDPFLAPSAPVVASTTHIDFNLCFNDQGPVTCPVTCP